MASLRSGSSSIKFNDPYYDVFTTKRLLSKIKVVKGCWIWIGYLDKTGRGRIGYKGKSVEAYVISFEIIGKNKLIPGLELDHFVCSNPACIRPEHIKQVTHKENILRGNCPAAQNARKKNCQDGHTFNKDNTIWRKNGWRQCKKCYNKLHPNSIKYPLKETKIKKEVLPIC